MLEKEKIQFRTNLSFLIDEATNFVAPAGADELVRAKALRADLAKALLSNRDLFDEETQAWARVKASTDEEELKRWAKYKGEGRGWAGRYAPFILTAATMRRQGACAVAVARPAPQQ